MILWNGQLLRPENEQLPELLNRSFRYGDGLFETVRLYRGRLLFWEDHLDRLRRGMMLLGFQVSWESWVREVSAGLEQLIAAQELAGPGRLRLQVWRSGGGAYRPEQDTVEWLAEIKYLPREYFHEPEEVSCVPYHGIHLYPTPLSSVKTTSALPYVVAARHARDSGADEAILFNHRKEVVEASSSNLFLIRRSKVITPPVSAGCLDGVMRKQVISMLEALPFTVEEKAVKVRDLQEAETVFLTNSIRGIQPVRRYQQKIWSEKDWKKLRFLQKSLLNLLDYQTGS